MKNTGRRCRRRNFVKKDNTYSDNFHAIKKKYKRKNKYPHKELEQELYD